MTDDLYSFIVRGGPLIWPILACSALGMAIFFERLWYLVRIGGQEAALMEEMARQLKAGRFTTFMEGLKDAEGPTGMMLTEAAAVCCHDRGAVETVLDFHIDNEVNQAARYMGLLSTLAAVSPLLGLLGTVTGLIRAFMVIEEAGGKVNASMLAGGIWEAMITTALGLGVAIVLLFCHRLLRARIKGLEQQLQYMAILFIKGMFSQAGTEDTQRQGP